MNTNHSFGTRFLALMLSVIMVLGMVPPIAATAEEYYEAQIGEELYETLEQALAAVPAGAGAPETTIKLLQDEVTCAFDVGTEDGNAPKKIILDLDGKVLKLAPAVGSAGTKTNGIRVLANSKLTLKNGQVKCSSDAADNMKIGIANYGTLELRSVVLTAGDLTAYSVNNRGHLTLSGSTRIEDGKGGNFRFGITNDPYEYIYTNTDAVVNCDSSNVYVQSMQVERYARETSNAGGVVLNITAGTFDRIVEDNGTAVDVEYNVSGGTITASNPEELASALKIAAEGATIKLMDNVTLGFDVGVEDGGICDNVVLDLNGKVLTTAPAVGSAGTKTNGIRVLANSALKLMNGTVVIPDAADGLAVKIGIANYGNLRLNNITVMAGNATVYTINNRGTLTLSGETTVNNGVVDPAVAITNDPYDYIYSNTDAVLNVSDPAVTVGKVLIERYQRPTTNAGGVVLNISAGTFASVAEDGGDFVNVTHGITGGTFGSDITAFVKDGYECIQNENGGYGVQFIKLEQAPLVFEKPDSVTVTYEKDMQVTNVATGGNTGGKITYELVSGDSVTVDADTGVATVVKAGTSKIRATMEGDEMYVPVSAEYELRVERADRELSLEKNAYAVYYGTVSMSSPALNIAMGAGDVSYKVIDGEDVADVDGAGLLTFKDGALGTVTVRITVAADDCYNSCTADYTVTVEALPTPDVPYQVEGNAVDNGWFNSDVTITAPGYTMSKSNSMNGEWVESFTYTEEGVHEEIIYLKDENGFITEQVAVSVKIDKTAPADLKLEYSKYTWIDEFKSMLGSPTNVDVIFSFVENGSGPAVVEFSLDGGKTYQDADYADGVYFTSVEPQYRGYVQFRVKDVAGLETLCNTNGTLVVVDKEAPGISVGYVGTYDKETQEDGLILVDTSEKTFQIIYTVSDENLDLQEADPTLTITDGNNAPVQMEVTWSDTEVDGVQGKTATLTLTEEGIYNIILSCSDRTNTADLRMRVTVDQTPPVLEVVAGSDPVRTVNGIAYYGAANSAIKANVRKLFFNRMKAGIEIQYTDAQNKVTDISSNYDQYGITVSDIWTQSDAMTNTKTITFGASAPEGTYTARVYYKGYGFNAETEYSEPFTLILDKSNPTISVSYQENGEDLFSAIFGSLGFSYAHNQVDVTIETEDSMSGIHHLVYNIGDGVEHIVAADELMDHKYTFTIAEEYRDMVYAKAVDMADNTMEATGHNTVIIDRTEASFGVTGVGSKGSAEFTERDDGVKIYTTNDEKFELIFEVTQQNFDVSVNVPVVEYRLEGSKLWTVVNETYLTRVDMTDADGNVTGSTIRVAMPQDVTAGSGSGDFEFRCTYSLFDGWQHSTSALGIVHFDANPPEAITIYKTEANMNPDTNSKVLIFHEKQQVMIQIKEKNFAAEDVRLKVMYAATKDGEYVELTEYAAAAKKDNSWKHSQNQLHAQKQIHEMELEFDQEGYYKLEVFCTDTLDTQAAKNIADEFVIDLNDPTDLTITYEEKLEWIEILESFFAFFNLKNEDGESAEKTKVVLSAQDAVSGIHSIKVSVDGREFEEVESENGAFVYYMEEGFRGQLSIMATDGAMRTAKLAEKGAIVVDSIDPVIEAECPADHNVYDEIIYTASDDFNIGFVVRDANYDLRAENAVVTVGDVVQDLTWTDDTVMDMPCGRTSLSLHNEGKHLVSASFADRSGNNKVWTKTVVVDHTAPGIEVNFQDGAVQNPEYGTYYQTAQDIVITITEPNFRPDLVNLVVTGIEVTDYAEYVHDLQNWTTVGDQHVLTITVADDAEYKLDLSCEDMAGNVAAYDKEFTVDQTAPLLEKITYSSNVLAEFLEDLSLGCFKAPVTVSITASDATSGVMSISYSAVGTEGINSDQPVELKGSAAPDQDGSISFKIDKAFYGSITAQAVDYANNESAMANVGFHEDQQMQQIVVDAAASERDVNMNPVRIVAIDGMTDCIEFEEGEEKVLYFQETALVEILLEEDNFFPENYVVKVNGQEYEANWTSAETLHRCYVEITCGDECNGACSTDYEVTIEGKDYSGNVMIPYKSQRIVLDHTAPAIDVDYTMNVGEQIVDVTERITAEQDDIPAMNGAVTAHVTIAEHNFRAEDVDILVSAKNGVGKEILELDEDGNVKCYIEQGRTQNGENEKDALKWSAFEGGTWRRNDDTYMIELYFNADANYTLQVLCEDLSKNTSETEKTAFIVDNKDPVIIVEGVKHGAYYNDFRTVTFRIQEDNFDPSGVVFSYTATSANGTVIELPALTQDMTWTPNDDKTEHVATLDLNVEANYTLSLSYTDPSGRTGKVLGTNNEETYVSAFTIDMSVPHDLGISYSDWVDEKDLVKYYDDTAKVTLEATDDIAGMMAFEVKLTADSKFAAATDWVCSDDVLTIAYDEDLAALNEKLLADGAKFQVYGAAGETKPYYENGKMIVALCFDPQFRGDVAFKAIDLANLSNDKSDAYLIAVDDLDPVLDVELPEAETAENQRLFYGDDRVTAKLSMTEANFYDADPVFKVNGVETALTWKHDAANKIHTAEYTMTAEGNYILSVEYTDRSDNVMSAYTSEEIIIDRTAPVVNVSYDLKEPVASYDGRAYYAQTRTAIVTVQERNFDANDVKFAVEAVDINGKPVQGPAMGEWIAKGGDVYSIELVYAADANYTFDVTYRDKAGNEAADYAEDLFTVDKSNPSDVAISYSRSVLETALNAISFGFYDAKVTVSLESHDITAGVQEFVYSYINASGVSGVNSGKTDQKVTANREGDKATASFQIPQSALTNGTQFNGTVTVTAIDRSKNQTTVQDDERIVVDNISPTATITYNAPVQNVDGTDYYADKITAEIRINEANFYKSDVVVSVTRDGVNYPVNPVWNDQSVDIHTGTFTLNQEGDYIVTVNYKDKSGNAMKPYTSGKMVIDQAAPTIQVSNVVANSANDDEIYTFSITVDDADGNLRASDIHPVLTAFIRDEDGSHTTQNIDLGAAKVNVVGKTYVYTVNNLEADAIYSLRCTATDLAGNSVNVVTLEDAQNYEEVRFSINRDGSTFMYGNEETGDLAEQYYVQNVDHDVIIREINVDPVLNYSVTVNGVELVEGEDYTTTISGGGSEWSVREYVISGALFAEEGEYSVVIKSVDATEATAYSDMKNLNMAFVVDRTAPTVVIGGLEDGGRYQNEGQKVTLIPSDEGGMLNSVVVLLYPDGADVETDASAEVLFEKSGMELMQYLEENGGVVTFVVPEGYQHTVHIICSDYAQGEDAQVNTCTNTFTKVTVSDDAMVIFFANKPLFYGAICGVLALLLFIFFLIFKRKKREEEVKASTTA